MHLVCLFRGHALHESRWQLQCMDGDGVPGQLESTDRIDEGCKVCRDRTGEEVQPVVVEEEMCGVGMCSEELADGVVCEEMTGVGHVGERPHAVPFFPDSCY